MDAFVKLTTPLDPSQAQPLLTALHAAGVEAFMQNEYHAAMAPELRLALGGFPVYVRADQREMAEAVLLARLAHIEDGADQLACPRCGGPTRAQSKAAMRAIAGTLTRIGFPARRPRRVCQACGHGWIPGGRTPFTVDELGYNPNAPLIDWADLREKFAEFLAWGRAIGRQDRKRKSDDREPPQ